MAMAITNRHGSLQRAVTKKVVLAGLLGMLVTTSRAQFEQTPSPSSNPYGTSPGMPSPVMPSSNTQQAAMPSVIPSVLPSSGLVDTGDLPIGAGDVISVQVFGTPELSGSLRVDTAGAITLPVGGKLQLSGMSTVEAATAIENRLKDAQIMIDPHITVVVTSTSTQGITIAGEVKSPSFFPLVGAHSVADALAIAGGLTAGAGDILTLVHRSDPGHPTILHIDAPDFDEVARNTPIFPRDLMTISKASVIYLIGDLNRQGPLPVVRGEPPTILNVIAQSGGVMTTAALSKALIIRKTQSGTTTIPLDLALVLKNRAPNILLQSADVLIVPHSVVKSILITLPQQLAGTAVGILTAGLYIR
jgi:polysaccharide export outer membrane protein